MEDEHTPIPVVDVYEQEHSVSPSRNIVASLPPNNLDDLGDVDADTDSDDKNPVPVHAYPHIFPAWIILPPAIQSGSMVNLSPLNHPIENPCCQLGAPKRYSGRLSQRHPFSNHTKSPP